VPDDGAYGWLSDIHLQMLSTRARQAFYARLNDNRVEAWLVSGDIADASSLTVLLREFQAGVDAPIWFVLGNHDYYRGTIDGVANVVREFVSENDGFIWLTDCGPIEVGPSTAVVGDDGWGDARLGNANNTKVELNDFHLIDDLVGLGRPELIQKLQDMGDMAARRLYPKLQAAASSCRQVVVVTHVPPFRGAAWHEGAISSDDWLPWFTCRAVGDVIQRCAEDKPRTEFLVLCGHTHGSGVHRRYDNVVVHTAAATYGQPDMAGVLAPAKVGYRLEPRP
jgi:3',5'-cyclic AMP phosphodiesterase CpdA